MVLLRCSPRGRCSAGVLPIFRGASVRECDFNTVSMRFSRIVLLHCYHSVELLHVSRESFSRSTTGGLLLKKDNSYATFNLLLLIKHI